VKSPKLFLVTLGVATILGALATAASAGRLSISDEFWAALWTRANFTGGIGTVECEILLSRAMHVERTFEKTRGSLFGYLRDVEVRRCARGGATLLRETLPWHIQYDSFGGTLPSIGSITTHVIGLSMRVHEPTFGVECLARSTSGEPAIETYNLRSNVITSHSLGGTIRCGSFNGTLSGNSTFLSRDVTITLI